MVKNNKFANRWKKCPKDKVQILFDILYSDGGNRDEVELLIRQFWSEKTEENLLDFRGIGIIKSGIVDLDLSFSDFSFMRSKEDVTFGNCNLSNSKLCNILGQINLFDCVLEATSFDYSNFKDGTLRFTGDIRDCSFVNASLSGASFAKQSIERCDFNKANMKFVAFHQVSFVDCVFNRADMRNVEFNNCEFTGNNSFIGTNLHNSKNPPIRVEGENDNDLCHVSIALLEKLCSYEPKTKKEDVFKKISETILYNIQKGVAEEEAFEGSVSKLSEDDKDSYADFLKRFI